MSKKAPHTRKYLEACASFVDALKDEPLGIHDFITSTPNGFTVADAEAINAFLAKAQGKS